MTKKNVFLLMAFIAIVSFFTSCVEDPISEDAPIINVSSPSADSVDVFIGDSVDFTIVLSAENGLTVFKALVNGVSGLELTNNNLTFDGSNNESVTVTVIVPEGVSEGFATLSFVVEDGQKSSTALKVLVISKKETLLADAEDFEWKRVGGNKADGLDMFGLTWTENTTTSAVIKKGADKFVELEAGAWETITSIEALTEAIDAAEDMDRWEKISAEKDQTHDLTLGTKVEDIYYLIHIANSTVNTDIVAGTTVTIVGQYKK